MVSLRRKIDRAPIISAGARKRTIKQKRRKEPVRRAARDDDNEPADRQAQGKAQGMHDNAGGARGAPIRPTCCPHTLR
jgi:hypothetical protein